MQSYSPLQTTESDFAKLEKKFFQEDVLATDMKQHVTKELFPFFSQLTADDIKTFRGNYWNLYIFGVWTYLGWFKQDEVIQIAGQQIPDAFRLGIDVYDKLIWYMSANIVNWMDIQNFYAKLKQAILNSEAPMGEAQGQAFTLGQVIKQLQIINAHKDNSIEMAQFYDFVTQLLFPGDMKESVYGYVNVDSGEVVVNFVNLANFIADVEPEQVLEAIDEYTTPIPVAPGVLEAVEPKENVPPQPKPPAPARPPVQTPAPEVKKPIAPSASAAPAKPAPPARSAPAPVAKKPEKMDLARVRQMINSQFKKDAAGQYEDITGVLAKLGALAEKNNDPKIAEMLYFDEQAGIFKWVS